MVWIWIGLCFPDWVWPSRPVGVDNNSPSKRLPGINSHLAPHGQLRNLMIDRAMGMAKVMAEKQCDRAVLLSPSTRALREGDRRGGSALSKHERRALLGVCHLGNGEQQCHGPLGLLCRGGKGRDGKGERHFRPGKPGSQGAHLDPHRTPSRHMKNVRFLGRVRRAIGPIEGAVPAPFPNQPSPPRCRGGRWQEPITSVRDGPIPSFYCSVDVPLNPFPRCD
jgi:hypothetical protein